MSALAKLVAPHGHMLVICRGADAPPASGGAAPWPLTERELLEAAALAGMVPQAAVCCFADEQNVPRIRAVFRRA